MREYFLQLFTGARSLLIGLGVTFRALFQPMVTVQYPRRKIEITPNFRGHTELVTDPESGTHRCIVCMMCEMDCPSSCIKVIGEKREGFKGKVLTGYQLDFSRCSLCGICVEVCPTSALCFSPEYELAGFSRTEFSFNLLARLEERT
ncbi:MAG: NADH-quinone oxidoreductase subunit I [Desulfuromonadales bacterium]|nr:NADH-quinone oxidoreductase subunit I [Desulfuromonadales bacterium]